MPVIAHGGDPEKAVRQQREFYEAIGRAIGQWAIIEQNIWHVYRRVIDPKDWAAAASAFHAVINQNTRLDMIKAAISTSRHFSDREDDWTKLHTRVRKQAKRRAKLAHWTPIQVADPDIDLGGPMFLTPPLYDFTKLDPEGGTQRIDVKRIGQWTNAFAKLAIETENFWRSLTLPDK